MRHIRIYVVALLTLLAAASCKKDLGNYDYREIPTLKIDTAGIPNQYTVRLAVEELVIQPKITYTGNGHLDYYWIAEPDVMNMSFMDTLSTTEELRTSIHLPISNAAGHNLFFKVVERETGNMDLVQFRLRVIGATGVGLAIAHELDGTSDFDLISVDEDEVRIRNIHQSINGSRLKGSPTGLGTVGQNNLFMFTTDQEMSLMTSEGLVRQFADREIFGMLQVDVLKPEAFAYRAMTVNYLLNNGKVYVNFVGNTSPGLMTQMLVTADGSDYRMAPLMYIGGSGAIFFDQLGKRFLQIGLAVGSNTFEAVREASPTARFSLHHIDRKFLYGKKGFSLYSGALGQLNTTLYAYFADHNGPGRYMYIAGMQSPFNPDFALIDLTNAPDIQNARFYDVLETAPAIYYATAQKLRLLVTNAPVNEYVDRGVQFTAPHGEEITALMSGRLSTVSRDPQHFYIATWNPATQQSTLRKFGISSGTGLVDTTPSHTWVFAGKVTRMEWKRN